MWAARSKQATSCRYCCCCCCSSAILSLVSRELLRFPLACLSLTPIRLGLRDILALGGGRDVVTACDHNTWEHVPFVVVWRGRGSFFGFCVSSLVPQNLTPLPLSPTLTSHQCSCSNLSNLSSSPSRSRSRPCCPGPSAVSPLFGSIITPSDGQQLGLGHTITHAGRFTC